ncbi:RidA family protein [Sphingomonas sp. ASV193]|uniref:RidA family protein n=1 Tax=Sphingomonas sp. ASV193 TaxID=3144405 RepID=UPI0032E8C697
MRILPFVALLLFTSAAFAAPPRPAVEHIGAGVMDGKPLPFSEAVRVGDILYLSGQLGRTSDGKMPDGIEAQTRQTLDNIGATLKKAGATHADLFHCTAFLADMKLWPAFNAVYITYFKPGQMPARSAVGVNGLALGALIELECQAYVGRR